MGRGLEGEGRKKGDGAGREERKGEGGGDEGRKKEWAMGELRILFWWGGEMRKGEEGGRYWMDNDGVESVIVVVVVLGDFEDGCGIDGVGGNILTPSVMCQGI